MYAKKVYDAILNLHRFPKSHLHKMDRVYQDLIIQSQIVEVTSNENRKKLESMLKNAKEKRPGP